MISIIKHDIFRRWYIDGRIHYHKVIDESDPKKGIQELRYIDGMKIKRVKKIDKSIKKRYTTVNIIDDYFHYNEKECIRFNQGTELFKTYKGFKAFCPSGLHDPTRNMVISYLHKAIKPVNQLRMIEDSVVIYRISSTPERRIFYIDVGNLPKVKAEQYLKDVMNRYRNKLVYNSQTGEVRDERNQMSMLEDFCPPRREGGRGTEITTLAWWTKSWRDRRYNIFSEKTLQIAQYSSFRDLRQNLPSIWVEVQKLPEMKSSSQSLFKNSGLNSTSCSTMF